MNTRYRYASLFALVFCAMLSMSDDEITKTIIVVSKKALSEDQIVKLDKLVDAYNKSQETLHPKQLRGYLQWTEGETALENLRKYAQEQNLLFFDLFETAKELNIKHQIKSKKITKPVSGELYLPYFVYIEKPIKDSKDSFDIYLNGAIPEKPKKLLHDIKKQYNSLDLVLSLANLLEIPYFTYRQGENKTTALIGFERIYKKDFFTNDKKLKQNYLADYRIALDKSLSTEEKSLIGQAVKKIMDSNELAEEQINPLLAAAHQAESLHLLTFLNPYAKELTISQFF